MDKNLEKRLDMREKTLMAFREKVIEVEVFFSDIIKEAEDIDNRNNVNISGRLHDIMDIVMEEMEETLRDDLAYPDC